MTERTGPQIKALNKFQKDIESHNLTETQFKKLSTFDKKEYLINTLKKKRGDRARFYGYYECYECAKADVFQTEEYISEED